ncbi:MAG: hypothetical protein WCY88_16940 [Spongiibacteraceae bacterium]
MKRFNRSLMVAIAMFLAPLSVLAAETPHITPPDQGSQACYLVAQRSSDYCRRVMFPPAPFR